MAVDVLYAPRYTNWEVANTNRATNPSFELPTPGLQAYRTNLHPNPSVEAAVTDAQWAQGVSSGTGGSSTALRTAGVGRDGGFGFRKLWTVAQSAVSTVLTGISILGTSQLDATPVLPNTQYTASLWIRSNRAQSFRLSTQYYNAGGDSLGTASGASETAAADEWVRIYYTFTTPATAAFIRFSVSSLTLEIRPVGTTWDMDQFLFEQGPALMPYFDGNYMEPDPAAPPALRRNLTAVPRSTAATGPIDGPPVAYAGGGWPSDVNPVRSFVADVTAPSGGGFATRLTCASAGMATTGNIFHTPTATIVQPGVTTTFSIWVKASVGMEVRPYVQYYDAVDDTMFAGYAVGSVVTLVANTWTRLSVAALSPYVTPVGARMEVYWPGAEPGVPTLTTSDWVAADAYMVEQVATLQDYFDGGTPAGGGYGYRWVGATDASASEQYGSDFTLEWTGAENGSTSRILVESYTVTYSGCQPVASRQWSSNRDMSLRIVSMAAGTDSFVAPEGDAGGMRAGMVAGETYTVQAVARLAAAQTGPVSPYARRIRVMHRVGAGAFVTEISDAAPNSAGEASLSVTFTLPVGTTEAYIRLYNGAQANDADVWWDDLVITEGSYAGDYFDGDTADDILNRYAWSGGADSSVTNWESREIVIPEGINSNQAESYLARMDATATSPTDTTAATPEFSAVVPLGDIRERYRQRGRGIAIRDNDSRGIVQGVMDGFTSTQDGATVSAISTISALVARVDIPAVSMRFEDFMAYLIGLVDPSIPVVVANELSDGRQVRRPSTSDTAWNILNEECLIHGAECVMYQDTVTFRPIRGATFLYDNLIEESHDYVTGPRAEFVEIKYYNTIPLGFHLPEDPLEQASDFWPVPRDQTTVARADRENVISIGSGDTVTVDIDLTDIASLTGITQPVVYDLGGIPVAQPLYESNYTVMDRNNDRVDATWWSGNGGRMTAEIINDGNGVRLTVTAPVSELAPFQIAAPWDFAGGSKPGPVYNLVLFGWGVKMSPATLRFHTGANPAEIVQEVGASIDMPGIQDQWDALRLIQPVLAEYSVPTQTISGSIHVSKLISLDIDAGWGFLAPDGVDTVEEQRQWYEERLFISLIGSRIRYGDSYYRITRVEFSEDTVNFDAKADNISDDWERVWSDAEFTYGDLESRFGDLTWEQWEAMPLWINED